MSLPAVNTPERPVRIRQRIFGLDCAESIASLIARYISCVSVFFFSGRRMVIVRVESSSATMMCSVMAAPDAVPGLILIDPKGYEHRARRLSPDDSGFPADNPAYSD